jgi:hypothetical protein
MIPKILPAGILFLALLISSCFKEDDKVVPHQPGNTEIDTVALTNLYKNQVYYDLSAGNSILSNNRNLWDLAFDCSPAGWQVRLNTSCFMYAASLESQEFGVYPDTTGAVWFFDNSNGNSDSTAIGAWFTVESGDTMSKGVLYLLNLGMDEQGNDRGFRQFVLDSLAMGTYYFRTAAFDGTHQKFFSVSKDPLFNNLLFDIDAGIATVQEPLAENWDMLFTQYTTLLYTDIGEPYPYLVTGVLLNPLGVEVARDSVLSFEQITFETAQELEFTQQQDIIGYDWKYYDFDMGTYSIKNDWIYIIRDSSGFYFKLRFLGFYNKKGEKGYPSIEYQRL